MLELLNPLTVYRGDLRYARYTQEVACLSTDVVGDPMCVRGDKVNGKWRVEKADPTSNDKMPAIGVLISKSTPTVGVVQIFGPVEDVYTGLDYGALSYLVGESGIQTAQPPVGGDGYVWIQHIGKAVASDILLLVGDLSMIKKK